MKNRKSIIKIAFFAICLVFLDSNAQEISYEYENGGFEAGNIGARGNGGRIVTTLSESTVNRINNNQNSAQLNHGRPTNQLAGLSAGLGVHKPIKQGDFNREYETSRPSQPIIEDNSNNAHSSDYQNNFEQFNRIRPNEQLQGGGVYSSDNNAFSRHSQVLEQNTAFNTNRDTNQNIQNMGYHDSSGQSSEVNQRPSSSVDNSNYHNNEKFNQRKPTQQSLHANQGSSLNEYSNSLGASTSNRPTPQYNDRNSVYKNNNNNNGISGFQSTGQVNQRRPAQQDSSENLYPSSLNSYQGQQSPNRNKNNNNNPNSGSHFQSNGPSNQERQTNNQFNPSDNGYQMSTYQRTTTRSPQFIEHDTLDNNNGYTNDKYHSSALKPAKKGGASTLGIIASNDGYVQSRPSQDLDRNTNVNTNIGIKHQNSNNFENNFQSGQGRPINREEESDNNNNNDHNTGNPFSGSENFEDSYESKPVSTFNRQNYNNDNTVLSKNKNNSNVNKNKNSNVNENGNINGNRHSNGNGNTNSNVIESGKKQSNPKNNNRHSQISAGHQGNNSARKPNVIGLLNSNRNKNSDSSNENVREKKTDNGGNKTKKRVSQIKYEQYLSSIFPDLDDEAVQEVKDFRGRKLARPGQFPHMGAIGFKNPVLNKTEYKCGASLISDIWAITTAHCTKYNELLPTYVRFGDLNLKAAEEDIDPQTRKISLIVNHPSYNDNSLYNDIALLQLDKVLIITEFVQPIRIWYHDEIPFTMAYAMGFGAVQFAGAQTYRLTQLELTIVPNDICARQMPKQPKAKHGIIDSQICAIDNKATESDTFQGDSGGPLEISFYTKEGGRQEQYLIGMTSFGVVGTTRLPGVYTRVSSYVDWIEKTVWSSEYNAL